MTAAIIDIRDRQFARDVARVHSHGPAFLARLLAAWAAGHLQRSEVEKLFRRAAELDPEAIAATGAHRWPT